MSVLDNIKLGRHAHLRTGLLDALLWFGRARREEREVRADIEERVIDFLRSTTSATGRWRRWPTVCGSAWNSRGPLR
jgi:ABC-type branched-subunit amino acid transport system ATPase component